MCQPLYMYVSLICKATVPIRHFYPHFIIFIGLQKQIIGFDKISSSGYTLIVGK